MRRLLLLSVLAVLTASAMAVEMGNAVGYHFGIGTSYIDGPGAPMNTSSDFSGIPVGFYFNLSLAPKMSVRTELNWLKYGFTSEDDDYTYYHYYDYLQIPVLIRLSLTSGDFEPMVFAGPHWAKNLDAYYSTVGSGADTDLTDITAPTEFGFIAGLGFSARFGWFHTDMDLRFTMGQSNVFTDEYPEAKFKSTLVTLGMGYAF